MSNCHNHTFHLLQKHILTCPIANFYRTTKHIARHNLKNIPVGKLLESGKQSPHNRTRVQSSLNTYRTLASQQLSQKLVITGGPDGVNDARQPNCHRVARCKTPLRRKAVGTTTWRWCHWCKLVPTGDRK